MAHRVGDYLKHDPLKIRFTSSNPQNGSPKVIIKRALNQSVADITQTNYYSSHPNVIVYYELLDISIIELETKKSLKVVWTGRNNKEEVSALSHDKEKGHALRLLGDRGEVGRWLTLADRTIRHPTPSYYPKQAPSATSPTIS